MNNDGRMEALERRIDELVVKTTTDIVYGKGLYREFKKHCEDDERRHRENIASLRGIERAVERFNDNFTPYLRMLRRMRARQGFRFALLACLSRWRGIVTAVGVTAGGLIVWFGDHAPKVAGFFKWLRGS